MASSADETSLGYDRDRFTTTVDDEFICSICLGVLRCPVQLPCEHMFCELCIKRWIGEVENDNSGACPNCRQFVHGLRNCNRPGRALLSLLNKLSIHCRFAAQGCKDLPNLTNVELHESRCDFRPFLCPLQCSQLVPKNGLARHIAECEKRYRRCDTCELSLRNCEKIHSKDDCIAALKLALKDCIDVIVKQNVAPTNAAPLPPPPIVAATNQTLVQHHLTPLNQPVNRQFSPQGIVVHEEAFDIYFPPPLHGLDNCPDTVGEQDSESAVAWPPDTNPGFTEIDLTVEDPDEENSVSVLALNSSVQFEEGEQGDEEISSIVSIDNGDSEESLAGTGSDISWHSIEPFNDANPNTGNAADGGVNTVLSEFEPTVLACPPNSGDVRSIPQSQENVDHEVSRQPKRLRLSYAISPSSFV